MNDEINSSIQVN
jgi:hypothetical protein